MTPLTPLTTASAAEREADRLRTALSGTLDQIVDNLTPANLASEAMAVTRAHMPAWVTRCQAFAQSPRGLVVIGALTLMVVTTRARMGRRRLR